MDVNTDTKERKCLEKEAFVFCREKINEKVIPMHLVGTEYSKEDGKLIFYFTAEERIDFRELVKDLANKFKTRIEMKQIGVRDEARFIGGVGSCGRALCCTSFLKNFEPVSIKMAKKQDLVLNLAKISGLCGRLMCCLSFEYGVYDEIKKDKEKMIFKDDLCQTETVINMEDTCEAPPKIQDSLVTPDVVLSPEKSIDSQESVKTGDKKQDGFSGRENRLKRKRRHRKRRL
ncbi:MAG: regulatory iron-sulfur-containing complex subunit RicT [Nitrospirota bacterium]